jgi:diguanylate cyclase (GGDEF)-like protein
MQRLYNRSTIELVFWVSLIAFVCLVAVEIELYELFFDFSRTHEGWQLDEIFTTLSVVGLFGLIYSTLRIKDLSREVKRRRQAEENVEWTACHDVLTGLPNRRLLNAVIAQLCQRNDEHYGVFSIDLNGFKKSNDLFGHEHGDIVLKTVAERLQNLLPEDYIFRIGGDEFLVIAECTRHSDLGALGLRIIRAIDKPVSSNGAVTDVGASVGHARYPGDSADLKTVINYSDCAMYVAKRRGRNQHAAFVPSMQEDMIKRVKLETDLKAAIASHEIVPYYQPLVHLSTKRIVGYEALARWEISPGVFVSPSEFVPLAEDVGLISELTDVLLRQACRDALTWPSDTMLSFNISAAQLSDRLLGLRILKILEETGLPVARLELEVTESALIQDPDTAKMILESLSQAGIMLALDDFGTGYSSLSQLSNFQFDTIKIDQSFVASFEHSEKQDKVIKAIIAMGAGLGVKVTAEGIEDEEQLIKLEALGCHIGQGYYFGRPAAEAEILRVLPERKILKKAHM